MSGEKRFLLEITTTFVVAIITIGIIVWLCVSSEQPPPAPEPRTYTITCRDPATGVDIYTGEGVNAFCNIGGDCHWDEPEGGRVTVVGLSCFARAEAQEQ